jgi:Domain of unknown function (DUF4349)
MHSPDAIAADRLEQLLAGAVPESEREARMQGLLREVRVAAPPASQRLRERVRALEEAPRRRPLVTWRRAALVAASAVAGVVAAALVVRGDSQPGETAEREAAAPTTVAGPTVAEPRPVPAPSQPAAGDFLGEALDKAASQPAFRATGALAGRARDVKMGIEIRVADADRLSEAANEAMLATRELGGHVAASRISTQGAEGRAELELLVPVGRVEDAVFQLSELGTITGQQVAAEDLQVEIDSRSRRIDSLRRGIRMNELRLASGTLDADERLRIQLELERQRGLLHQLRREARALRREAATAELSLTLHTRAAAAEREEEEGGLGGAARDALDVLGAAGSVALFLAIVLSPLLALAVLVWLALRAHARRQEARLLERAQPASRQLETN